MKPPMTWTECQKHVRKVELDIERIRSLLSTSEGRLTYIKQQEVTDKNVSFIVEGYYEVLKELLTAFILMHSLSYRNHQCLIAYFKRSFPHSEYEIMILELLCYRRNRLDYYGEPIEKEFYDKHRQDWEKIIVFLRKTIRV
jgi:hypothetical protein